MAGGGFCRALPSVFLSQVFDDAHKLSRTLSGPEREVMVKGSRSSFHRVANHPKQVQICPQTYVFYEKRSGVAHFRVEAEPDGRLPLDHAAALLAMHCLVRGQAPADYAVLVESGEEMTEVLKTHAEALLNAGRAVTMPVALSRREEEVLGGILRSLANKEIASSLNLSERTVKFHVSALLAKFRVRGRMELVREAGRMIMPRQLGADALDANVGTQFLRSEAPPASNFRRGPRTGGVVPMPGRRMTA
jgi:DNA-binding CsgD family transcriptional regulator